MILITLLTILTTLLNPKPALAQEHNLIVTQHTIQLAQKAGEEQEPSLEIIEQLKIKNQGSETFKDILQFGVASNIRELSVIAVKEGEGEGTNKVLLDSQATEENTVLARLAKEVYIEPGKDRELVVVYNVKPDSEGNFLWQRKILHEHTPKATVILVNPLEGLGYEKKSAGFAFQKGTENGFYVSEELSPQKGSQYSVALQINPETAKKAQEQSEKEPGPLQIINQQVKRLIFENIIFTFLLNDIILLGIAWLLLKK